MDIVSATPPPPATSLRTAIRDSCREDETEAVARILAAAEIPADMRDRIAEKARGFVAAVRRQRLGKGGIDAFLHEYALSSPEGVALLCLAEALLRIPDTESVDRLIRDKIDSECPRWIPRSAAPIGRASSATRSRSSSTPRPGH